MNDPSKISIKEYNYILPEEKIASHPLEQRDASKLLIYNKGTLSEDLYSNIADHLPTRSMLVFNNSKVIHARIKFKKNTGGIIEVFCLEPYELLNEYSSIMNKTAVVKWKCLVGGASKWKEEFLQKSIFFNNKELILKATLIEKLSDAYVVEFTWTPETLSFAEVIEQAGDIPLPPYIKRGTDLTDASRYQTIYAKYDGSVAAPTAGLHFTENVFKKLTEKNIDIEYVTLHVGAGTFKPVKSLYMKEHEMHAEWIDVNIETIKNILAKIETVIAVGTTSLRTLETLYWLGVKTNSDPGSSHLTLDQWEVYKSPLKDQQLELSIALRSLVNWMEKRNMERLFTQTKILIAKGYQFKIVKALITNFHQPQSTLLLLVSAAVGDDWKKIYNYAMKHDYRFLSYGDGNLIFISQNKTQ